MTIEQRTDYLWGLFKGEAKELCRGSVIEWEIASKDDKTISQSVEVKTPDIITVKTLYPGQATLTSLYQEEINNNEVIYSRKVNWANAIIGKVDKVHWVEDEPMSGKMAYNTPILIPIPTYR